ncbi:MAG: hydrolase [Gemmatimonadaceae bacterium]|nr:hydrolase [Gemmatimonadaceae bacterium]
MPRQHTYAPAWWVPGPHLRTLYGRLTRSMRRGRRPLHLRTERWTTPDDDVLELRRLDPPDDATPDAPRLVLLHGLEGGMHSHYVANFFGEAAERGWGCDLILFRGCNGEPNRARRFYHSGETSDIAFAVDRIIAERPGRPLALAGVSLGGNVLLKYLGELGDDVPAEVKAAAAMSVPFDLARGCRHIQLGFSKVYERHFLKSLKAKARAKLERYPDLILDAAALDRVETLWDFDDVVTAPVHGFESAQDYYDRSSSIRFLQGIRVPTLLLSAEDDPFLPREVLAEVREIARAVPALELEFVKRGGHVGFTSGWKPWKPLNYGEWRMMEFLGRFAVSGPGNQFQPLVS